jgi:hypothetical protein
MRRQAVGVACLALCYVRGNGSKHAFVRDGSQFADSFHRTGIIAVLLDTPPIRTESGYAPGAMSHWLKFNDPLTAAVMEGMIWLTATATSGNDAGGTDKGNDVPMATTHGPELGRRILTRGVRSFS